MKLFEIKTNTIVSRLDAAQITDVLEECLRAMRGAHDLLSILDPNETDTNKRMEQVDEVEALVHELKFDMLDAFVMAHAAASDPIHRRASAGIHYLKQFRDALEKISDAYIPMSGEQIRGLQDLCRLILGELTYFVYYQFDFDVTGQTVADDEMSVNVCVVTYCDREGERVEKVLAYMQQMLMTYKPQLTIFEEYPELEDEFYAIAGAYIKDFDTLSEYVTVDIVREVISGKGDVEAIIRDLEQKVSEAEASS